MRSKAINRQQKHILILTGEHSGDIHGAQLAKQLLADDPTLKLSGIGSTQMQAAGVDLLLKSDELAVMGLVEILSKLPKIRTAMRQVKRFLKQQKPDLVIFIDYSGFNLRMAKVAKTAGLRTLYYIGPQLWAWRTGRIKKIKRWIDHMAVVFPFEVPIYEKAGVPVTFVGHPLDNQVKPTMSMEAAQTSFLIDTQHPTICLMPGSRMQEIERLMPVMVEAVRLLQAQQPHVQFLLALADNIDPAIISPYIAGTNIQLIRQQTYDAIQVANLVITASGTATLEIALLERPMVILYKMSPITHAIVKRLIKIPYIGLANILAGEKLFPELIQNEANPQAIAKATLAFLNESNPQAIQTKLKSIKHSLQAQTQPLTALIAKQINSCDVQLNVSYG